MEDSLNTCHVLAHCYTALLESMHEDQHRHKQLSSFKLKEALFNVRQYEAFLCILMVRQHLVGFKKKKDSEIIEIIFFSEYERLHNLLC